jgi:hypothetical protein
MTPSDKPPYIYYVWSFTGMRSCLVPRVGFQLTHLNTLPTIATLLGALSLFDDSYTQANLLFNQRIATCDRETDRILSSLSVSLFSIVLEPFLDITCIVHFGLSGDMATLLAPVRAAVAADAALLSQESKSLFCDVRNCRAAVSHLQVKADFICSVCRVKVTL